MRKKEVLTLMYRDLEVLTFSVDYKKIRIEILEKLEHFERAPFGIDENTSEISMKLLRFFNSRSIPATRYDYEDILKATGCGNGFELSFRGHGLSLSNHYWFKRKGENYKYADINFFTNKWDDSFARAVLSRDYEALKHCDLNVPDIVTPGWGSKGWIFDDGPKLYKLGIAKDRPEEAIAEALASKIAAKLFNEGEYLNYELKQYNGQYASVSSPIVGINKELIPLSNAVDPRLYLIYRSWSTDKAQSKVFFERLDSCEIPGIREFFIKVSCFRDLCFVSDLHFDNISIIRDLTTGKLRLAPLFDLGGAFGSSKTGQETIRSANRATLFMIYSMFSDLDPEWDYSWYDPKRLEGSKELIEEYLSKSEFYNHDIIECIFEIFDHQKAVLDEFANNCKKK